MRQPTPRAKADEERGTIITSGDDYAAHYQQHRARERHNDGESLFEVFSRKEGKVIYVCRARVEAARLANLWYYAIRSMYDTYARPKCTHHTDHDLSTI